jgi:hypothetical protein
MEKMHYRESKPGIQAVARYYTDWDPDAIYERE